MWCTVCWRVQCWNSKTDTSTNLYTIRLRAKHLTIIIKTSLILIYHTHTFNPSQGPEHCNECRNYYIEEVLEEGSLVKLCMEACPLGTYLNISSRQCVPCHRGCRNGTGCAGPLPYVNRTRGCLECDHVQLDREGRQVRVCVLCISNVDGIRDICSAWVKYTS